MEDLNDIYLENKSFYKDLQERITSNIHGRIPHHRIRILHMLTRIKDVSSYLEIGVHNGASMSYVISQESAVRCVGIDLFDKAKSHYEKDLLTEEKAFNNISRNKGNENSEIKLIRGCSRKPSTYESIEGREFDLIFIDGDHSYKGVKSDFTRGKKYLKEGGFLVLDDYERRHKGVVRFADKTINPNRWRRVGVFFGTQLVLEARQV